MRRGAIIALLLVTLAAGCGGTQATQGGNGAPTDDLGSSTMPGDLGDSDGGGDGGGGGALNAAQKAMAEAMTSIWENDTPILDYAYSENINDGRGYTSGRAGFCTGTGDAIQVIDCYDKLRTAANGNLMAKYMPALTTINDKYNSTGQDQGDTSLLDAVGNWVNDWGASYNNATTRADFKKCQDQVSDLLYYTPAMQAATQVGLATALSAPRSTTCGSTRATTRWSSRPTGARRQRQDRRRQHRHRGPWLQKFIELRRDLLAGDSTWTTRSIASPATRRRAVAATGICRSRSTARSRPSSAGRRAATSTASTRATSSTPTARRRRPA